MNALRASTTWWLLGALVLAGVALWAVVMIAFHFKSDPPLCRPGLQSLGPACCAPGQELKDGQCSGEVASCPPGMVLEREPRTGCVSEHYVVDFPSGTVTIAPLDWEAEGRVKPRQATVKAFSLDALEVSVARWQRCVQAKSCRSLPGHPAPGLPVSGISPQVAERFCLFVGGRLPTSNEWLYAAAGSQGRRFPWGDTGLVCRRAVFGLLRGPCASGAVGPTLVGSRPAGNTPEGLYDMAGNVAEWTREGSGFVARGGSFRSVAAHELKTWASENTEAASLHIGFRCAYDPPG